MTALSMITLNPNFVILLDKQKTLRLTMPGNSTLITMKSLLDALHIPMRDGQIQNQNCHWAKDLSEVALGKRREANSELRHALTSFPSCINFVDEADLDTPKCVDSQILCESHYELYQQLMREHGKDVLDDQPAQPMSPKVAKPEHEEKILTPRASVGHGDVLRESPTQGDYFGDVWAKSGRLPSDFERGLVEEEDDNEEVIIRDDISKTCKRLLAVYNNGARTLTRVSGDSSMLHGTTFDDTVKHPNTESTISGDSDRATAVKNRTENGLLTPEKGSTRHQLSPQSVTRMIAVRSPMEQSYSPRALKALAHLEADGSYEKPVATNEESVRKVIGKTSNLDSVKGFVYALRDKEFELVKIGSTKLPVGVRGKDLKRSCNMIDDPAFIYQVEVLAYKKLEKIIQQDLRPHRLEIACKCRTKSQKGYTMHQEYFAIDDNTARRTLQFWSEFFTKQQPWGDLSPGTDAKLTETWVTKLATAPTFEVLETHDRHDLREKRWRNLLEIPIPEVNESNDVTTESADGATKGKEFGTTAAASTALPYETTPSKSPRSLIGQSPEEMVHAKTQAPPWVNLRTSSSEPCSETMKDSCGRDSQLPLRAKESAIGLTARLRAVKTFDQDGIHADSRSGQSSQPVEERSAPELPSSGILTNGTVYTARLDNVQSSQKRYVHESGRVADTFALESALALATKLLTKEVKSQPKRTIFTDLWKLRWPLACCVVFVVYSPYLPPRLTYLMWSLFLPLFVAELRGWTDTAESGRSSRVTTEENRTRA